MGDPRAAPEANELPSADDLRTRFDAADRFTLGLEEEVMVLDPQSLDLAPHAPALLQRLGAEEPYKLELPASQLEITAPVVRRAGELAAPLHAARAQAARAAEGLAVLAAAAVHPFSAAEGELNDHARYYHTRQEYGPIAARQLVCALHVHVAVGAAEAALAVYNGARVYLPLVAALAANGAIYGGRDSGLASMRPKLCEMLPRQGVPPALASWEELADIYAWGARSRTFIAPRTWWWELRLHPAYGTLEFRVPDTQSTVADAVALAGVVQALVAWLAERHAAGETLPTAATWQIEENRWSACRHGLDGRMVELPGGRPVATADAVARLLEDLRPSAARLDGTPALDQAARMLAAGGGAAAQRERWADGGAAGVASWLVECFLAGENG